MKPVSIRISNPCHEDWEKMTPTDKGKFCASCQKNVTDFTAMTDNEILAFLENHTGPMCGQLRPSQLNRAIVQTRLSGTNYRLNAFFAALVVAGGAGSAMAQDTIPPAPRYTPTVLINERHPTGPVCIRTSPKTEKLVLNAVVMDTISNQPAQLASVTIKGTNITAETDQDGKLVLEIPDTLTQDTLTLMIHTPGYSWVWVTIPRADIASTSVVEIALQEIMMKGDLYIERRPWKK